MRVGLTRSLVRSLHLHRTMARPVQDSWQLPVRAPEHAAPVLKVYNSLTRTKVSSQPCAAPLTPPDGVHHEEGRRRELVQLWPNRVRRLAHGTRTVRSRLSRAPTAADSRAQELHDAGHYATDPARLLWLRRPIRDEHYRRGRQGAIQQLPPTLTLSRSSFEPASPTSLRTTSRALRQPRCRCHLRCWGRCRPHGRPTFSRHSRRRSRRRCLGIRGLTHRQVGVRSWARRRRRRV